MRTASFVIMIGSIAIAACLPVVFLFRHSGKKMDNPPFRHWFVGTCVALAVGLAALIVYGLTA